MLVEIEARILIFPGTDFHFSSTSVPPGTFLRLWHFANVFIIRNVQKVKKNVKNVKCDMNKRRFTSMDQSDLDTK